MSFTCHATMRIFQYSKKRISLFHFMCDLTQSYSQKMKWEALHGCKFWNTYIEFEVLVSNITKNISGAYRFHMNKIQDQGF